MSKIHRDGGLVSLLLAQRVVTFTVLYDSLMVCSVKQFVKRTIRDLSAIEMSFRKKGLGKRLVTEYSAKRWIVSVVNLTVKYLQQGLH